MKAKIIALVLLITIMVMVLSTGCGSMSKSPATSEPATEQETKPTSEQEPKPATEQEPNPPAEAEQEPEAANPDDEQGIDCEWFEDLIWTGEEFLITVKKQLQLADVSVFAGEDEYKVRKSVIDLGGVTGTMGGIHDRIIYLAGGKINWFVDTNGQRPDRIVVTLASGEVFEVKVPTDG